MAMPSTIARPATDTNYSSGPRSGSPTKNAPSAPQLAQGFVAGDPIPVDWLNYILENYGSALSAMALGIFGQGTDGAQVIGAGTTTLTDDMHATTIVVQNGGILAENGFRIFATTSITVDVGGIISCDGLPGSNAAAGVGGAAGASRAAGTTAATRAGGAGGNTANNGANATAATTSLGGPGNAGGTSATQSGGTGGTATAPTAAQGRINTGGGRLGHILQAIMARALDGTLFDGGGGGGGGAGGAGGGGGGGGAGGGVLFLAAPTITNNGTIRARGGAGADGAVNGGGGSGGGGGAIIRLHRHPLAGAGSWSIAGGVGGAGPGTGNDGNPGDDGDIYDYVV